MEVYTADQRYMWAITLTDLIRDYRPLFAEAPPHIRNQYRTVEREIRGLMVSVRNEAAEGKE